MLRIVKRIFMTLLIVALLLVVIGFAFMQQPQFGKLPKGERAERIRKSPHFRDGQFRNLSHTPSFTGGVSVFTIFKEFFFNKDPGNTPPAPVPSKKTNIHAIPRDQDVLVWFGHSSYYLQVDGKRFLVDPVLSGSASPVSFITKSFAGSDIYNVEDLPDVDYLLLTHDHYDHLDYETLLSLKPRVKRIVTGLGTGEHLEYWGFDPATISEHDWYEEVSLDADVKLHVQPARHFSGRGFKRNQSLWVSFVVITPRHRVYIGGDSGYDDHFRVIGEQYGPFDLAILECGQYNKYWQNIHMMPEETVQAAIDLKAKRFIPVHWGKFSLAIHAWDEPIIRSVAESVRQGVDMIHPVIGEMVDLNAEATRHFWWEDVK
jgi:L-ascorbate metabolism protein UlaG (beta-lactamase superfamily)